MFKFLREKIKKSIENISKNLRKEKEAVEGPKEGKLEEKQEPIKEAKEKEQSAKTIEVTEEPKKIIEVKEEQKGIFSKLKEKITTSKISEEKFDELFQELEISLLESNVAYEVIDKIKDDLKNNLVNKPIKRGKIEEIILDSLRSSLEELFNIKGINLIEEINNKKDKPYIIAFFGINGVGKTSSISKIAKLCKDNNLKVVFGAGDSFRKGAIEQLEEWGKRLDVKVIKHQYGSDPAAICYDTIKYCKAHKIDVALLDTAGRMHSNENLMKEMEKIIKVAKPDLKVFVGESLTGNDAVMQSKSFDEAIGIDGIILTKSDVDERGGATISIEYVTKKPILYLSHGQNPGDLKKFDYKEILQQLNL